MLPSDLRAASDFTVSALRSVTDRDWSVPAGSLDWDCAFTVAHVVGALTKYTVYLAAGATRWSPIVTSPHPDATPDALLDGLEIGAAALAFVASHVDDETLGYHAWGMSDRSASLARGAEEVLVHGWDVAQGLGADFEPPAEVCAAVVARRYPWAATGGMEAGVVEGATKRAGPVNAGAAGPWATLLVAAGRTDEPAWVPVECPLSEWDGERPAGGQPAAVAWTKDDGSGHWVPTYPES